MFDSSVGPLELFCRLAGRVLLLSHRTEGVKITKHELVLLTVGAAGIVAGDCENLGACSADPLDLVTVDTRLREIIATVFDGTICVHRSGAELATLKSPLRLSRSIRAKVARIVPVGIDGFSVL